ncbi:phd zinc finger-containing protein [Stylonychia lemnae]|uniref:Phd zinc finger-containing protein n=1 Tax=Stylonychia lemnae TaxID=5949 RepID=A0A078B709_STYLE|nr:phd zinc finger-containing protein [Stylonychia lemnae]|eukprot:CDW90174.1 phd zinc finger-containing protein [Stylonychia lemnae]
MKDATKPNATLKLKSNRQKNLWITKSIKKVRQFRKRQRLVATQSTVINETKQNAKKLFNSNDKNEINLPAHKKPYEQIYISGNDVDEDIHCDVCLEFEQEDDDQIIICELCNVACHQQCYGSELLAGLTTESWYCQRCKTIKDNNVKCDDIKCFLCPDIKGLMKEISKDKWAHVICVNWNPDIYFNDEKVEGVSGDVQPQRFQLSCNMCKVSGQGACIQCDFKSCSRSYHVRCAVKRGLIDQWSTYEEKYGEEVSQHFVPIFCCQHQDKGDKLFKQEGQKGLICKQFTPEYRERIAQINKEKAKNASQNNAQAKIKNKLKLNQKVILKKKQNGSKIRGRLGKITDKDFKMLRINAKKSNGRRNQLNKPLAKSKSIKKARVNQAKKKQQIQVAQKTQVQTAQRNQQKKKVTESIKPCIQEPVQKHNQQDQLQTLITQARVMIPQEYQAQFDQFISAFQSVGVPQSQYQEALSNFMSKMPLMNMNNQIQSQSFIPAQNQIETSGQGKKIKTAGKRVATKGKGKGQIQAKNQENIAQYNQISNQAEQFNYFPAALSQFQLPQMSIENTRFVNPCLFGNGGQVMKLN